MEQSCCKTGAIVFLLCTIVVAPQILAAHGQQRPLGGTLIVHLPAEPGQLDFSTTTVWMPGVISAQIFNSLLTLDRNWNILPSLAWKWEVNANEKYFKFWLINNATWHDGKPFTAADAKFSIENIQAKVQPQTLAFFKDTKVEIVDDYTVIVRPGAWQPGPQLLLMATRSFDMFPKHILEREDIKTTSFHAAPVGTGPFRFKEWVKGSHIVLEKNPNYWKKGMPYLDKMIFKIVPEPASAVSAYEKGELDYMFRGVPYELYERLKGLPNTEVYLSRTPNYKFTLALNLREKRVTSNKLVRQALFYATDRDEIIKRATSGLSMLTDSHWFTEVVPQSPNIKIYRYDPKKAEELLDQAGYTKDSTGKRLSIEIKYRRGEPEEASVVEMLRDQWAKVGVEVKLNIMDFGTLTEHAFSTYDYDIWVMKLLIDPFMHYNMYHSTMVLPGVTFSNSFAYRNPEVDKLFDQWLTEPDKAKQTKLMQRIDEILSEELPALKLYDITWLNVKRADFKGPNIPIGIWVFYDTLEDMYWAKGTVPTTTATTPVTTRTTTTAPPPAAPDYTGVGVAIAAIVVIAVAAMLYRRKIRPSEKSV